MKIQVWWYTLLSGELGIIFCNLIYVGVNKTEWQIMSQTSCWMLRKENENPSLTIEFPFLSLPITTLGNDKVLFCPRSPLPGGIADNSVIFSSRHKREMVLEKWHWAIWTNPKRYGTVEVQLTSKRGFSIELWPMWNLINCKKTLQALPESFFSQ